MSKRFAGFFAALGLALCLHAPSAIAGLIVTATSASGYRGDKVSVTLNVAGDGSGSPDLSAISAYTFNFLWNPAVLDWAGYTSTPVLTASTLTVSNLGSAVIDWFDLTNTVDFSSGLGITASFTIVDGAAYGPSTILFGDSQGSSVLVDESGNEFPFSGVTEGNPMQVTVLQAIPEPGAMSMVLAALGILGLVRRRNRKEQA